MEEDDENPLLPVKAASGKGIESVCDIIDLKRKDVVSHSTVITLWEEF